MVVMNNKKLCSDCRIPKDISEFYQDKNRSDGLRYQCKQCCKKRASNYNITHRKEMNLSLKKWRKANPIKTIQSSRLYYIKHRQKEIKRSIEWAKSNPEKCSVKNKKSYIKHSKYIKEKQLIYNKTKSGIIVNRKHAAKRNRNLGWELLFDNPFPEDISVEYHHVNKKFVIPIPKNLHRMSLGKNHKEKCEKIIMDVYCLDINKILSDKI